MRSRAARGAGVPTDTVFIVDDDESFARSIARLVQAAGWNARVFPCAGEFLDLADPRNGEAACVLLDVKMPGMKGPDVYRAMLDRKMTMPVVFLTGHGDVPTSVDVMKLGAVDFLEKPVPRDTLIRTIRGALARDAEALQHERERREIEERVAQLSPREREVMGHVIAGRLNKQIAADLGISLKTVKAHRAKVMEKMRAGSVAALVDLCRVAGIQPAIAATNG